MSIDVEKAVKEFIVNNFVLGREGQTEPGPEESLSRLGLIDSTGVLELISFLEEHFGISVADADTVPENLDSIRRISTYVARKQAAK